MSELRPLSNDEIAKLVRQGCRCTNWSLVEVAEALSAVELRELLAKSPGVSLSDEAMPSPTILEATESESVLVGRVRRDSSSERGLLLWLAADPVRLAASNAVRLAETRYQVA